jgi:adenosylhomocysteine nucleosidase
MSDSFENHGIVITGGTAHISQTAVGRGARVTAGAAVEPVVDEPADVAIITVLSVETKAIVGMLRRAGTVRSVVDASGRTYHVAMVEPGVRVVATQALDRGQRSVIPACEELRKRFAPRVIVLAGIAGGIHTTLDVGDVAVATDMVYYDARKETAAGTVRRGESLSIPPWVRHRVNDFFATTGEPAWFEGHSGPFKALPGPIGSGEAVIADADSPIRQYLEAFNDKILAVDTETGGFAQYLFERSQTDATLGWLGVRGVSDRADAAKDDSAHVRAAENAAITVGEMLGCLSVRTQG